MKALNVVEVRRAVRTGLARTVWNSRRSSPGVYRGRSGLELLRRLVAMCGKSAAKPTGAALMAEALAEKRGGGDGAWVVGLYGAALTLGASSDAEMDRFVDLELFSRLLAS